MFQYYFFAVLLAATVALAVTGLSGFLFIPMLRRLKYGQNINEEGPTWHKGKQGTPTMGGVMFIFGSFFGLLCAYLLLSGFLQSIQAGGFGVLMLGVGATLLYSLVGFVDDYIKVKHKENLGLRWWQKILMQALISGAFMWGLHAMGQLATAITLPFFGPVDLGVVFYPLAFLLLIGMVNAVNLTDGLDGLASSVTLWVLCGYLVLFVLLDKYVLSLWAAALGGGCIGFLLWNFYPAKVFMGDTGSMFLGGAVTTLAFCMGRPEIILLLGVIYLAEAFSVMIQVTYFKITHGKRLFKMTPIHHHFEMKGWSEPLIVASFSFVTLACAILAIIITYITL